MVSGRGRDDVGVLAGVGDLTYAVVGATDLERSSSLQVLGLDEDRPADKIAQRRRRLSRSLPDDSSKSNLGISYVVDRDHETSVTSTDVAAGSHPGGRWKN
jgi:hypothetical protein